MLVYVIAQASVCPAESMARAGEVMGVGIARKSVGGAGRAQRKHVKFQAGYSLATCRVRPEWMSSTRGRCCCQSQLGDNYFIFC